MRVEGAKMARGRPLEGDDLAGLGTVEAQDIGLGRVLGKDLVRMIAGGVMGGTGTEVLERKVRQHSKRKTMVRRLAARGRAGDRGAQQEQGARDDRWVACLISWLGSLSVCACVCLPG